MASGKIPVVDLDRIESTYEELKKMEVRLDPNPIEYGPRRFNNRIAQVRALLSRVEQIFLQTSEDLHVFKRLINTKRALYELEKRDLMINDPKCRVGRSQNEREALADVQLRDQIESIQKLELAAHDLEALMVVIKAKRTDLKDIQGRMRDQMKLIEHDLGMGARWGRNAGPSLTSQSVNSIHSLLDDMDAGMGIVADSSTNDDTEEEPSSESLEETEEEEEEVVVVDTEDPTPHAEDPVLVFGDDGPDEEMEAKEDEAADDDEVDGLIPTEDDEGTVPEDHTNQEAADSFLDALGAIDNDETSDEAGSDDDGSIEDLIASFSDD